VKVQQTKEKTMQDFWYNVVPLAAITLVGFLIYGLGQVIFDENEKSQIRYEHCIAADKQWIEGNCVK
jgi:hypothetical protein